MGKKTKIGKQRRDKYYQLAKETGYRSRAAFKLVQLNRKYEFLQKSHALIDLCAAPGGWLQVASQFMPIPSLILGVDLVPIKPIPNVITLQDDITKDSCRQALKKELKTWDADCVLHDGSPNVGQTWIQDAFGQAQLTLSALKLACELLRKGGCFVTKIFRSKDYPALIATFGKLFKKVYVTKPAASRAESAEIYVFCQHYMKPERLDPALVDPKSVFKELNLQPEKPRINLIHPEKTKRKAEGYADGDYTLFHRLKATDFIQSDKHLEALAETNEIVIDDRRIEVHEATTNEVRECCKDIKVLGRKELRELLNWRKTLRKYFQSLEPKATEAGSDDTAEKTPDALEEEEEQALDREVEDATREDKSARKRKRKKEMKEKRKKKQKLDLKMVIPGDQPDNPIDQDLFNLERLRKNTLKDIETEAPETTSFDNEDDQGSVSDVEGDDQIGDSNSRNPLVVDFDDDEEETKEAKEKRRSESWFQMDVFADLENEVDEDEEIERMANKFRRQHGLSKKPGKPKEAEEENEDEEPDESNVSADIDTIVDETETQVPSTANVTEQIKLEKRSKKTNLLSPEELALGEMWVDSAKSRRNLVEFAYNRYMNNDENLPDWFEEDERKHWKKQLPVTKEQVEYYKRRMKDINARPIKKVIEAKGRKRRRALKKLDQARKKADAVVENADMSEHEKAQEMRKIYKQANAAKKKDEVKYVVTKKGTAGKRVRRPPGVKGRFRLVDPRLKKDVRRLKNQTKGKGKRKSSQKTRVNTKQKRK